MTNDSISHLDFFCDSRWYQTSTFSIFDLDLSTFWITFWSFWDPKTDPRKSLDHPGTHKWAPRSRPGLNLAHIGVQSGLLGAHLDPKATHWSLKRPPGCSFALPEPAFGPILRFLRVIFNSCLMMCWFVFNGFRYHWTFSPSILSSQRSINPATEKKRSSIRCLDLTTGSPFLWFSRSNNRSIQHTTTFDAKPKD